MSNTIQTTINWAQAYVQYAPLRAGTGGEPTTSICSMVRNTMLGEPFAWSWNRFEDSSTPTQVGVQDYTINLTNFGWLEKASLTDPAGKIWEIKDIYNTNALSKQTQPQQRPSAIAVIQYSPGVSVKLRFMGVPDQIYQINLTFQGIATEFGPFTVNSAENTSGSMTVYTGIFNPNSFPVGAIAIVNGFIANPTNNGSFLVYAVTPTTLTLLNPGGVLEVISATVINGSWYPIPDQYSDIYNNLVLAEIFQVSGEDQESARYRQRGVAALLARSEGLTETQKNAFAQQYLMRNAEAQAMTIRTQQGNQARGA